MSPDWLPLHPSLVLGFRWADPDLRYLLVHLSWWPELRHRDDFDRFIICVYNGDHDHIIFFLFGDSFSFPLTR
jgi:hypothetical protein